MTAQRAESARPGPGGSGPPDRKVAVTVQPDWGPPPRTFTLRWRSLQTLVVLALASAAAMTVMLATWVSMTTRAGESDALRLERDALLARRDSMAVLAERLAALEASDAHVRSLFGLGGNPDSALWLPRAAGSPRAGSGGGNDADRAPTAWPLAQPGFITQSLLAGTDRDHPGIDIAIPTGSYVRAAGGGQVVAASTDPTYGLFVLIDHGGGVWSRYGHLLHLSVARDQEVRRGEVIALSGSTGQSTAPHLHFEILNYGRPIDPLDMVTPP